jgi:hypothetical protein
MSEIITNVWKKLLPPSSGRRSFGERRPKWENNIQMDLKEVFESVASIRLTEDRCSDLLKTVLHLAVS